MKKTIVMIGLIDIESLIQYKTKDSQNYFHNSFNFKLKFSKKLI